MTTRAWQVYGREGHRQREAFNPSTRYWGMDDNPKLIIDLLCEDVTSTAEYAILVITADTPDDCFYEMSGQLSDGIFENSRTGVIEEIPVGSMIELYGNCVKEWSKDWITG